MKRTLAAALAVAIACSAGAAQAVTLLSNLPTTGGGQAGINTVGTNAAMGFTVPAGTDYLFDSLTLSLRNVAGDTPLIRLYSDSGTNPDAPLMTFANPTFATNELTDFVFTPVPATTLMANASYWIVVQSTSGSFNWVRDSNNDIPTGTFTYLGTRFNGDPPTRNADGFRYGIQIDGTAVAPVPLPATLPLLGFAIAGLAGWRRYSRGTGRAA